MVDELVREEIRNTGYIAHKDGYYCRVWFDVTTQVYIVETGFDGQPSNWCDDNITTIEEAINSMKEFTDLYNYQCIEW